MDGNVEYDRSPWDEEEVELYIEEVKSYMDSKDQFITELRVLNGPKKGALKTNLWFKFKRDGDPRKDSLSLFSAFDLPIESQAFELKGRAFKTKPWYPTGNKYPVFTKITPVIVEDPF